MHEMFLTEVVSGGSSISRCTLEALVFQGARVSMAPVTAARVGSGVGMPVLTSGCESIFDNA